MRLGDVLEWIAGALLVAAVFLFGWHAVPLAFLAAALFIGYEAQCLADAEFKIPRPRLPRRKPKAPVPVP